MKEEAEEEEDANDNPIEEVRLTVPITDDPSQPVLTFRTWILGLSSCVLLAFVNKFFRYRENQLYISSVSAQILMLPIGKFMANTLPDKKIGVPFTKWRFSLNPGPFTLKEHVLITIFANSGSGGVYAVYIITMVKAFYHRNLNPLAGFLLSQTTQRCWDMAELVCSEKSWWTPPICGGPQTLSKFPYSEREKKQGRTHKAPVFPHGLYLKLLLLPHPQLLLSLHLVPLIRLLDLEGLHHCPAARSGLHGMGLGSFGFDWSTIAGFLGSPLAYPAFAIVNVMVGFFLTVYVMIPVAYWSNAYEAKRFPLFSAKTFDFTGHTYNITRVLNQETFDLHEAAYNGYSKLYLSVFFAFTSGLSFATLAADISHVGLFHGKHNFMGDVHTRIMKRNYEEVPSWWFYTILAVTLQPGLNVITELVIGYLYLGKPLANVAFKTYGYISMSQAIMFLSDFKLGHYMKIPSKSMFVVQ
ncbi:unnamed protein product [Camellia sinensis]